MPRGPMYVLADPVYTTAAGIPAAFPACARRFPGWISFFCKSGRSTKYQTTAAFARACCLVRMRAGRAIPLPRSTRAGSAASLPVRSRMPFMGPVERRWTGACLWRTWCAILWPTGAGGWPAWAAFPWNVNDAVRVAAFHQAMRAAGLSSGESDVFSAGEGIDACAARMLERAGAYDGALCVNDQVGVRLLALAPGKRGARAGGSVCDGVGQLPGGRAVRADVDHVGG